MTTRTTDRISFRWPVLITALALGLFARAGWTSGETITQSIGTMEPGQSVTIVFDATIDNPQTPINNSQVCNQGLVSSANHADVQTDDPALGGAADSTCTAVDAPAGGTIVIVKDTVPDAAQDFAFTTTGGLTPAGFSLDDDADATLSNTQTYNNLVAGSYTVTETAVAGYTTTLSCVDPDSGTTTAGATATIDLDDGETVTCTFTNTAQPGTIVIVNDTLPDAAQDFAYTTTGGLAPATFSLDDDADADATLSNTQTYNNLAAGSYSVTQTAVAGYATTLSCVDPSGGTTTASPTATIDLAPGETVTCTFTNSKLGTIVIVKDTVPDAALDFAFTTTGGLAPAGFSLDDDTDATPSNTRTYTSVVPGTYTVTESTVAGYATTLSCVDPDSGTTTASATATIDLDPGETVTCTFTSTAQPGTPGTIVIVKDTLPDGAQDFAFTTTGGLAPAGFNLDDDGDPTLPNTQTYTNVAPGAYTITETAAAGYTTGLSCVDPDGGTTTAGATATIDLDDGETVTCTFTNTAQPGSIVIVNDTVPDGAQDFSFSTTGGLSPATFQLDDDADGTLLNTQTFSNVATGFYTVTETAVAGYITTLSCVDTSGGTITASATASINLAPGETVTCTFTNTAQPGTPGTIVIIKDTDPDAAQDFAFSTTGGLAPATFVLDDDADGTLPNTQTYTNVATGAYTVTETAVAGYTTTVSCMDPSGGTTTTSSTASINIALGETVTCTFSSTSPILLNQVSVPYILPLAAFGFALLILIGPRPSKHKVSDG